MTEEEVVLHHDKCRSFNLNNKKEVGYGQRVSSMKVRGSFLLNESCSIFFGNDVSFFLNWKTIFHLIFCTIQQGLIMVMNP